MRTFSFLSPALCDTKLLFSPSYDKYVFPSLKKHIDLAFSYLKFGRPRFFKPLDFVTPIVGFSHLTKHSVHCVWHKREKTVYGFWCPGKVLESWKDKIRERKKVFADFWWRSWYLKWNVVYLCDCVGGNMWALFHQQSYISIFVSLTAAAWVKHQEKMIKGILFVIKTKTEFWSSSFLKLCLPSLLLDCIFNMPTVSKAFLLCSY